MNKHEVQRRVLQGGRPIDMDRFSWDEDARTFSSDEDGLVIDFAEIGDNCTFKTGSDCTFKTGFKCTFDTGDNCTFDTGSYCTLKTGDNCTFDTGFKCTFDTGCDCTFDTGSYCTFDTGDNCTFDTGGDCTFDTGARCVVIRRDIYEIIEVPEDAKIKLNSNCDEGYHRVEDDDIKIDVKVNGKTVSLKDISEETLIKIRKQC